MFKKKGSSTNVAIVCSLFCAALGVYYGLSANHVTPPEAPAIEGSSAQTGADHFSASVAEAVSLSP